MASLKVAQETAQQWQTLHGYADRMGYISDPQGEGVTGQCVMGLVPCSSDSHLGSRCSWLLSWGLGDSRAFRAMLHLVRSTTQRQGAD